MAEQSVLDVPRQRRSRPRLLKRVLETVAVALPAVAVIVGVALLSGAIVMVPETWFFLVVVVILAAGVFTQHWVAYVALLVAGVVFFLTSGLLVLAAWVFGAIYAGIALANLIPRFLRLVGSRG